jgi:DNA primase
MAGVTVTVASLGTALTDQQARLVKRFTDKVFILYDGDDAGLAAARRAVDVLLSTGAAPQVIVLPEDEDPDSFVRKQGGEAAWKLRNEALSPIEFQLFLMKRNQVSRADAVRELVASAALMASPVEQDVFLRDISSKTAVSTDALRRELARVRSPMRTAEEIPARGKWPSPSPLTALTRVLVRRTELRPLVFEKWTPPDTGDPHLTELLTLLYDEWKSESIKEPAALLDHFPESPLREFLAECLYESEDETDDERALEIDRRTALDCLNMMEADKLRALIAEKKRRLAEAPEEAGAILPEMQRLMREEKRLRAQKG